MLAHGLPSSGATWAFGGIPKWLRDRARVKARAVHEGMPTVEP